MAVTLKGVMPLKLDVTSRKTSSPRRVPPKTLICSSTMRGSQGLAVLADGAVEAAREHFEVNFVGPLRMARGFRPGAG